MKKRILLGVFFNLCGIIVAREGDIAQIKCKEYASLKRNCSDFACNSQTDLRYSGQAGWSYRVIGGTAVKRFDYPHMAAIGYGNITQLRYLCGGTVISEYFVITAAHCRRNYDYGAAKAVRLGSTNLLNDDANTRIIPVDEIIQHPDYTPRKRYNDIALIRVKYRIEFNDFIWPACLNIDPNNTNWRSVTAIGFGVTSLESLAGSDKLLKVRLNIIPHADCRRYFQPKPNYDQSIIKSQLCAGDLRGHRDTCSGDSGGPLQILLGSPLHMYVIVGITSFGKKCGFPNMPAVYTNVAFFTSWIEDIVWGDGLE